MYEHITKDYIRSHTFQGDGLHFPQTGGGRENYRLGPNAVLPAGEDENRRLLRMRLTTLVAERFPNRGSMEASCDVSYELVKKYINGSRRVTRDSLAKLCVGMRLSVEEAQGLFRLEGHSLEPEINLLDAIVVDALQCGDNIGVFYDECVKYGLGPF